MALTAVLVGLIALGLATVAGYLSVRRGQQWASPLVVAGGVIAVGVNAAYLAWSLGTRGMVATFRHNFESTLLLATLLCLVGLGTYLSRRFRGMDGLLFVLATLVEIGALLVINRPEGAGAGYKPWFVSHSLAFMLAAACFLAGGAAGIAYLLTSYVLRRKRSPRMVGTVAPLEAIEHFERWALVIGFPLFTYGILTGICGMVRSGGEGPRGWLSDPLVIASFLTWCVYAALITAMWVLPQMRGRRAAALVTCGMGLVALVLLATPLHG